MLAMAMYALSHFQLPTPYHHLNVTAPPRVIQARGSLAAHAQAVPRGDLLDPEREEDSNEN
jgi:hypothetical protein